MGAGLGTQAGMARVWLWTGDMVQRRDYPEGGETMAIWEGLCPEEMWPGHKGVAFLRVGGAHRRQGQC